MQDKDRSHAQLFWATMTVLAYRHIRVRWTISNGNQVVFAHKYRGSAIANDIVFELGGT